MDEKLSSSLEDYLKTIFTLCQKDQVANANKIAQTLDVKKSSVSWALKQLSEKKLINYLPYLPITLTATGEAHAKEIFMQHEAIKNYLIESLGINPGIAEDNACRMEHVIDREVLDKMISSMQSVAAVESDEVLPKESERGERDLPSKVIKILLECGTELLEWQKSVIKVFMGTDLHQTTAGLAKECLALKSDITEEQVQRVIDILCEHRFAEPLYLEGKVVYEHLHPESHHDHFFCVKCGGIIEFYDPRLEYFQEESARQAEFRILDHRLVINGVCAECLKKESAIRSLDTCMEGEILKVVRINSKADRDRIFSLGLLPGVIFDVVVDARSGNMILLVNNSRITIDVRLASSIKVTTEACHKSCGSRGYHRHQADRGWRWGGFGRRKKS